MSDLGLVIDYVVDFRMQVHCDFKIMLVVAIAFAGEARLRVYPEGLINAIATTAEPVLFNGIDKLSGAWGGIQVESTDPRNKLIGCKLEYLGGDNNSSDYGSVVLCSGSSMEISNANISNRANYGINANNSG